MRKIKLVVCIPSTTMVHADFAMCLANMVSDLNRPVEGVQHQFTIVNVKTSILSKSREKLAEMCVANGATHMLFLDSDMVFPPETFRSLVRYDFPVVAANCPTKAFPSAPTARTFNPTKPEGDLLPFNAEDGLRRVWRVGTGVMLIDCKIFRSLPKPWFNTRWDEALQDHVGEDWVFCENLERAGVPIYVDQELSVYIGHVGSYTFSLEDCEQLIEVVKEVPK